ncbi:MAG: hypothetical protein M3133_08065 [Actinomycetota bacterium]|nr:hypothetical protein [Actinomycetota bacterium]
MQPRYRARLRAAAFGMAAAALIGMTGCDGGREEDGEEGGLIQQEEGGEQEDEGE